MAQPASFDEYQWAQRHKEHRMRSDIATRADFNEIRYGQCWEDADILVEALQPEGRRCLSIASAGDNALALLAAGAKQVVALDLSEAQLACLALRVAAYRVLDYDEFLQLMGARHSQQRQQIYARCRPLLTPQEQRFWDARATVIAQGIGSAGKFERYFSIFRRWLLPLVHSDARVNQLLQGGTPAVRETFYEQHWNTWRWRALFRVFFSRWVMGRLGRDPEFFAYVEGGIAEHLMKRTRHALVDLNPADNPYLQWILKGRHVKTLPYAWRPEAFNTIKERLDCLEWQALSLEAYLEANPNAHFDAFNLSDIFEYMSQAQYECLLQRLVNASLPKARFAYWNMAVPRSCPLHLQTCLTPVEDEAQRLHQQDKAFFYRAFVLEQLR